MMVRTVSGIPAALGMLVALGWGAVADEAPDQSPGQNPGPPQQVVPAPGPENGVVRPPKGIDPGIEKGTPPHDSLSGKPGGPPTKYPMPVIPPPEGGAGTPVPK
jgi:hypothetical protein